MPPTCARIILLHSLGSQQQAKSLPPGELDLCKACVAYAFGRLLVLGFPDRACLVRLTCLPSAERFVQDVMSPALPMKD